MEKVKENVAVYHDTVAEKNNPKFFSMEQVVEIPTNRRIYVDVPLEVPAGKAHLEVKVVPFVNNEEKPEPPLKCLIGVETPRADALLGILSHVGDITLEEIRDERLAKYLK